MEQNVQSPSTTSCVACKVRVCVHGFVLYRKSNQLLYRVPVLQHVQSYSGHADPPSHRPLPTSVPVAVPLWVRPNIDLMDSFLMHGGIVCSQDLESVWALLVEFDVPPPNEALYPISVLAINDRLTPILPEVPNDQL